MLLHLLSANTPLWKESLRTAAAVIAVLAALAALFGTYLQAREQTKTQKSTLEVQTAQRALNLMRLLIDVERTLVDRPHLARYFRSGNRRGEDLPPRDHPLHDEILACGVLFTDFAEAVGWQAQANQLAPDGKDAWRDYFKMLFDNNPAVRAVASRDAPILSSWTCWLLGLGPKPPRELRDLRRSPDPELLDAVYSELFVPNFRDPDEQETPDDWARRLWGNEPPPHPQQHGCVVGIAIDEPEKRRLDGFAFVEHYRGSRCGLLSYIAVADHARGQKLAGVLYQRAAASARDSAQAAGAPLRAIFAEIHDPERVVAAIDAIDPRDRVRIMAKLGARRVPIGYVQPALGADGDRSDRLMLVAFTDEPTLPAGVVRDFLREFYAALGVVDLDSDPDLTRMEAEVGSDTVALEPLDLSTKGTA